MQKVAFVLVSLALLAAHALADTTACCEGDAECKNIVCQPCNNYTRCPECFPDGPDAPRIDWRVPCCKQLSQVVALTAASVSASTQAFAAAQAASFAATKVVVAASAGASVGSFVSIAQTLSLSINTGKCCEIAQDVQANASAYAKSFAASAAEAEAAAAAVASAAAAASAASAAASSLYAQAESLITSSCCGFDLQVYSAVLAAGNYAVQASACVEVATAVSTCAQDAAKVCSSAASESSGSTSNWAQAKTDNCCNNNFTKSVSANVAGGCLKVIDRARELHGYAEEAFDFVAAYAREENCIETALTLCDEVCNSECRDVKVSCCEGGCDGKRKRDAYGGEGGEGGDGGDGADAHDADHDGESDDTCCLASRSTAEVFLAAKASAEAAAQAAVYSQSVAQVYTETVAVAYTAARAASGAAASIKIDVQSCCSVVVTIDTAAFANAKAVGKAFSASAAAAKAFSYGYGVSQAVSRAVALGVAAARSTVQAFYSGCCGKTQCEESRYLGSGGRLRCCDYTQNVVQAFSQQYVDLVSTACTQSESLSKSESAAATGAKAQDCTNLIRRATTRSAFLLQCCCCNTKNVVASTLGYGAKNTQKIYFDDFEKKRPFY